MRTVINIAQEFRNCNTQKTITAQNFCFGLKGGAPEPSRGNGHVFEQGADGDDVAMEDFKVGGQWAILPAMVRYDHKLPPNAKLIYAEIAAKINEEGYCFASNRYFSERFKLKEDTVSGLVRRLADAEYIRVDLDAERQNRDKRRIYLTGKPYSFDEGIGKKSDTGKKSGAVSEKKPGPIENNIQDNDPPKAPQGGKREKVYARWEPEMFERFWKLYPRGEAKGDAREAWDKLKPDMDTMWKMSEALKRQLQSEEWKRGIGIPYASRWIKKRRWEDEIKTVPEQGPDTAAEPFGGYEAW